MVLSEIREKKEQSVEKKKIRIKEVEPKEIERLREIIRRQENDIKILKNYNETLKKRLEKIDEKFKEQKVKTEKFHDQKTIEENKKLHQLDNELEKNRILS